MSYTPPLEAEVTAFKTTTPLASGATFTSSAVDVNGYSQVQTEILASHDGTINISFCSDVGLTDVVRSLSIPYVASNGYQFFAAPAFGNFIEYNFTNNGTVTQTDFYYTTKILTTAISPQLLTTGAFIAPSMVTSLGRNIQVGQDVNGTFVNAPNGGIDDGNSTSTPLSGTGVFNGTFVNTDGYVSTSIFVKSDQDSATKGVQIIHSSDGVNDERVISFSYISADNPQGIIYLIPASTKYFRMKYINGAVAQTGFTASIKFETSPQMLPTLPVNIPISDNTLANTVKSISVGQQPDGTYNNSPHDGLGFSTSTPLISGSTYDSGVLDMSEFTQVQTDVTSDGSGTIDIEFIRDAAGTDVLRNLSIPYVGGSGFKMFSAPAFTPYVRYQFTSTTTGMTDFYFDTKFTTKSISGQILGMEDFISPSMVANLGRNVIVGKNQAGRYNNVAIDTENNLNVNASNPKTSYDEIPMAEMTPIEQLSFPYNINSDIVTTGSTNGGTVVESENMAVLNSSSTSGSLASFSSNKNIPHRSGQGTLVRIDCLFTATATTTDSKQWVGIGDDNDGFLYGYDGQDFSISYRTSGTTTVINQTNWNTDTMDGSNGSMNPSGMNLDPSKGNVYQISYGDSFAAINFSIEDDSTGNMVLVHILKYNNLNITPSTFNATFPLFCEVGNGSSTDVIITKVANMSAFIEGKNEITGPLNAHSSDIRLTQGSDGNEDFFTLRGRSTFAGKTNKVECLIESISASQDSKAGGNIFITEDATVASQNAFVDIGTNTSVVEVSDSLGNENRDVSGGKLMWASGIGKETGFSYDISNLNIRLRPGHTLTFSMEKFNAATDEDGTISVVWKEDF